MNALERRVIEMRATEEEQRKDAEARRQELAETLARQRRRVLIMVVAFALMLAAGAVGTVIWL